MKKVSTLLCLVTVFAWYNACSRSLTVSKPAELLSALAMVKPGDTIFVRGGLYKFDSTIRLSRSGDAAHLIHLFAYPKDVARPKFDFSAMAERHTNNGFLLTAGYWHIKGIDVVHAGHNGLLIAAGHHNLIEFCTFSECRDTGLQLAQGASNNTILNCDSYFNADSTKENADGFASKTSTGSGNKFVGCRAWQNLDDGYDGYLRGADSVTTTYENCYAFKNGYTKEGVISGGDGNGFKTGGSDKKDLKHFAVLSHCVAAGNAARGFDHNSNRGTVTLYNCTAHNNKTNYGFTARNPLAKLIIKNCVVLGEVGSELFAAETDISHNSWQNTPCGEKDFQSLAMEQLTAPRKKDGSLPEITYLHLVAGSNLIDKGVNVGLPYYGKAPDLGAFEYGKK